MWLSSPSLTQLDECVDWATEVEVCFHGATQVGDDEGEGKTCSPNSWPQIRDGQSEGTATHLRDVQPEERRGMCFTLILLQLIFSSEKWNKNMLKHHFYQSGKHLVSFLMWCKCVILLQVIVNLSQVLDKQKEKLEKMKALTHWRIKHTEAKEEVHWPVLITFVPWSFF